MNESIFDIFTPRENGEEEEPRKRPKITEEIDSNSKASSFAPDTQVTTDELLKLPATSVPAKVYPFKLDTFQQDAVNYIEKGESVLVAAHTSAGKTAVAEYAIAKSLRDGQRVIYTSPIKALSNQKYRDIQEEFKDVGLMTGDMTINPGAACLIMTTEILRSMLYRGSEVVREVAWVIYDEVHYMRDKERGVVWEESIILLPHKVRFVFLSATIPNANEFVGWVQKLHRQPCHVVYTDYRPVPLQHFVFPSSGEGLYLVVDEKGKFRDDNFQKAMSCLQAPSELDSKAKKGSRAKKGNAGASDLFKIVRLIMDRELDPCIVFSFSKKECETFALQMSRLDFNNDEEKELVEQVFLNAMEALSEDDQNLPQIKTILPLLKRGVGIHHGGLLPILKEVIEILFQEGLIKVLFATETFSIGQNVTISICSIFGYLFDNIGINMPAKTVVFSNTRKYDGKDFRWITSGEYIQMSGRAGRRGKDDRGIVIQMLDEKIEPDVARNMIYGASDPLHSSYHVGYNMVLNMMRVEDSDPENLLRWSFHQYQQERSAPELEAKAEELQREALAITVEDEDALKDYYTLTKQLSQTEMQMCETIMCPEFCLPFLNLGRLMYIRAAGVEWGWGVLVNYKKSNTNSSAQTVIGHDTVSEYVLDVLLPVIRPSVVEEGARSVDKPVPKSLSCDDPSVSMEIMHVALRAVVKIGVVRVTLPKDIMNASSRKGLLRALSEINRRFHSEGGIPTLDPVQDMGINDPAFSALTSRISELKTRISKNPAISTSKDGVGLSDEKSQQLVTYERKINLLEEARLLRQQARESQTIAMKGELRKMKRVLVRLGYVSAEGVLSVKGRFSCELSTGDELVLTDMVFDGVFADLSVAQTVAILSCFVHKELQKDSGDVGKTRPDMQGVMRQLQTTARNVAKNSIECQLQIDEEEYVRSFNPGLIDVAYAWAQGSKFSEICRLTDVFEGSIIRALRRLEELLRQLSSASLAIGNAELQKRFLEGSEKIRRGVVFAASLYL